MGKPNTGIDTHRGALKFYREIGQAAQLAPPSAFPSTSLLDTKLIEFLMSVLIIISLSQISRGYGAKIAPMNKRQEERS
jgi:hypothetical protein